MSLTQQIARGDRADRLGQEAQRWGPQPLTPEYDLDLLKRRGQGGLLRKATGAEFTSRERAGGGRIPTHRLEHFCDPL